jgi:hypothetical protein
MKTVLVLQFLAAVLAFAAARRGRRCGASHVIVKEPIVIAVHRQV